MDMQVNVTGGELPQVEIEAYIAHGRKSYPDRQIERMDVKIDGEYVDINYFLADEPFTRIRRITGYLVGDMSHWNNAKRAEEADRVKHTME
ncbi:MAG: anaerobic ribonucleoside-triphosphate reductase [Candidatus Pelethousia sp.]|nr:anaerobic ribonucleoside-triphosphate reductase [Candidatus Pelethousia sp.]